MWQNTHTVEINLDSSPRLLKCNKVVFILISPSIERARRKEELLLILFGEGNIFLTLDKTKLLKPNGMELLQKCRQY